MFKTRMNFTSIYSFLHFGFAECGFMVYPLVKPYNSILRNFSPKFSIGLTQNHNNILLLRLLIPYAESRRNISTEFSAK